MRLGCDLPSARFVPALFVCGALPVLLCGGGFLQGKSFWAAVLCAALGFAFMTLCFIPFYILKKKYNFDFGSAAEKNASRSDIIISAYYAAYFMIAAASLILRFTDMFTASVNSEADPLVMGLLILAACAYAATRTIKGAARVSTFISVFLIISLGVIFCGSVKYFDFTANSTYIAPNFSDFTADAADCLTLAFVPVLFGFVFCTAENVKFRHAVGVSCAVFGLMLSVMFFVFFVCGSYSGVRSYSVELLAQASGFGDMRGFDGLYTAACTGCLFATVSALLCCARRCVPFRVQSGVFALIFAFAAFVIFGLAIYIDGVKRALTDSLFLTALNIISALIIPSIYLFKFKAKSAKR